MSSGAINMRTNHDINRAIIIGGSSGSTRVIKQILSSLPRNCKAPVLLVRHLHVRDNGDYARHLARSSRLPVLEPHDKQRIEAGHVYVAPANYHMMVESDLTISLSVCQPVNWSRPSIDVLFDSAARTWGSGLIAVLLSGASSDGTEGLRLVKKLSGTTIVQDPDDAIVAMMPGSAVTSVPMDHITKGEDIAPLLNSLMGIGTGRVQVPS